MLTKDREHEIRRYHALIEDNRVSIDGATVWDDINDLLAEVDFLRAAEQDKAKQIPPLQNEIDRLKGELSEYESTFDLRWKADMRAIKRWQGAGEGRELTWPDHADLVVWLIGEIDRLDNLIKTMRPAIEEPTHGE